jgi:serine/threonine protein kinase
MDLQRDVALKALPEAFAQDPDRLSRFQREAQILASLNHPNIAQVYGLTGTDQSRCIVMELVEGETLDERIRRGAIPIDEARGIARQIIEGIEAAHEKNVVHRDLKTANIKLSPDGRVKVLDFGLAKSLDAPRGDISNSPTISVAGTQAGMILGTAAYMSPEQAKGRPADSRSDIWAFGCVLYEMLAGKPAFNGESFFEILGTIMKSEPDWTSLPPSTPVPIRSLLGACLQKDPKQRLRNIGDARFALDEATTIGPTILPASTPKVSYGIAGALVVLVLAAVVLLPAIRSGDQVFSQPFRFSVSTPLATRPAAFALSPDSHFVVFSSDNALWVRPLDRLEARRLEGTENAEQPFWSPDSHWIAFIADGKLQKTSISGDTVQTICAFPFNTSGATWGVNDVILFGGNQSGLFQVSASGGMPVVVTTLDPSRKEIVHTRPQFLPDGNHFLYRAVTPEEDKAGIYVDSLKKQSPKFLVGALAAYFAPPNYLIFVRSNALFAQLLDMDSLQLEGQAVALQGRVGLSYNGAALFSVSKDVLVMRSGIFGMARLNWVNRDGEKLGSVGQAKPYRQIRLSPDERTVAVTQGDERNAVVNIWLLELATGIASPFTFHESGDPVWSPDSRRLVFDSTRNGKVDLFEKAVGDLEDKAFYESSDTPKWVDDWAVDGSIIYHMPRRGVFIVPTSGERKPKVVSEATFTLDELHTSPDGKWIAYNSDEAGRTDVHLASFPDFGNRRRVSNAGGGQPLWRKDGRELYYLGLDGTLMAVDISIFGTELRTGVPKPLFKTNIAVNTGINQYAVAGDGRKFLLIEPVEDSIQSLDILANWRSLLRPGAAAQRE